MYGTGSDPFFTDSLLEAGDSILSNILELPVISSLAGSEQLSREELRRARNNFYIQDYFYLVYGYKVVEIFLLDTTSNSWLLEQIGKLNPMLSKDYNPLLSISVTRLLDEIDKINTRNLLNNIDTLLSVAGSRPNQATQNYIIFKIQKAFLSELETLIVNFACISNFYRISKFLIDSINNSRSPVHEDPEFKYWLDLLTDLDYQRYFDKYQKLIDNFYERINSTDSTRIEQSKIEQLRELFVEACRLEYKFFDSLLA